MRGIFYIEDHRFIEPPFKVEFYALDHATGLGFRQVIDRFGRVYAREPGVSFDEP